MDSWKLNCVLILIIVVEAACGDVPFDDEYEMVWGTEHVNFLNHGTQVQLWMDISSGAGFGSKLSYGSGFFEMKIKLPGKDSAGVVTAFYLTSNSSNHDELDFEFLGNREGKPITLQTNVFANGVGNREQRILLWFDPTADYHTYKILWNQYQIVFYVDNIPIRVFRNRDNAEVKYPNQAMKVQASLWDGEDWATDGGQTKTDWSHAPFIAQFQDFDIQGCPFPHTSRNAGDCHDQRYWWNDRKYSRLSEEEQREFEHVRQEYMNYDYCMDTNRHPSTPPECAYNI